MFCILDFFFFKYDIITNENKYCYTGLCFVNVNYDFSGRWYVSDKPLKERQPHHLLKGHYFLREKMLPQAEAI